MSNDVRCPMCKKIFKLDESYEKGDTVYCSECYEELMVVSIDPLRVSVVPDLSEHEELSDY